MDAIQKLTLHFYKVKSISEWNSKMKLEYGEKN